MGTDLSKRKIMGLTADQWLKLPGLQPDLHCQYQKEQYHYCKDYVEDGEILKAAEIVFGNIDWFIDEKVIKDPTIIVLQFIELLGQTAKQFWTPGVPKASIPYNKKGLKHGKAICFDMEGCLYAELHFKDGKKNGKQTQYHPSKKKSVEENWINGRFVSYSKWDFEGNLIMEEKAKRGGCLFQNEAIFDPLDPR